MFGSNRQRRHSPLSRPMHPRYFGGVANVQRREKSQRNLAGLSPCLRSSRGPDARFIVEWGSRNPLTCAGLPGVLNPSARPHSKRPTPWIVRYEYPISSFLSTLSLRGLGDIGAISRALSRVHLRCGPNLVAVTEGKSAATCEEGSPRALPSHWPKTAGDCEQRKSVMFALVTFISAQCWSPTHPSPSSCHRVYPVMSSHPSSRSVTSHTCISWNLTTIDEGRPGVLRHQMSQVKTSYLNSILVLHFCFGHNWK